MIPEESKKQKATQNMDIDYGLDQIIDISLLKVTKIQTGGIRDEGPKLLVIETLQKAVAEKIHSLDSAEHDIDNVTAFAKVLQEAIQRLGLSRCIKITLETPEDPKDHPRIRIPMISKKVVKDTSVFPQVY